MRTINAIPLEDTDKLMWVRMENDNCVIFKAVRINNVQGDKPKSNKELNK